MRQIVINIQPRAGTQDNSYIFDPSPNSNYSANLPYQFAELVLNYSLLNSGITSTLILSMNQPVNPTNVLRSGQPIEILDNGSIVFQGVLLSCQYLVTPMTENSQGGIFLMAILAPSIYQLTLIPMIFDTTQANQISSLLGINTANILAGGIAQNVSTSTFLNYIVSNTDYSNIFQNTINSNDLGSQLFLMVDANQSRDSVLRQSINFYNCVFYQAENGQININQLTSNNPAPFSLDLTNSSFSLTNSVNIVVENGQPVVPLLQYNYTDNAYSTPAMVSNYAILDANIAISAQVDSLLVSYKPNPTYFPRLQQLQNTGWFTGIIGKTQINQNIVTDPTAATALNNYITQPDQYMVNVSTNNVKDPTYSAYQSLLTGKELANSLNGYATLNGTISLDQLSLTNVNTQTILGTIVEIANCDLKAGIIASVTRSYSLNGSYLNFNVSPLGSLTGYWKG